MSGVSDESISTRIAEVTYLVHKRMTVCLIELDNGFIVLGEASCINPADFDAGLGRTLAYARARSKLWAYFGFAEAERILATNTQAPEPRPPFEHDPLSEPTEITETARRAAEDQVFEDLARNDAAKLREEEALRLSADGATIPAELVAAQYA